MFRLKTQKGSLSFRSLVSVDSGAGHLPTAPHGKRRKYSICLWPPGHLERSPICHFYTSNLQKIDYYLFSYHKKLGRPEKSKEDLNIKHPPKLTESRAELFDLGFCSKVKTHISN